MRGNGSQSGFTLRELLVVMAAILLLAALVLPLEHTGKRVNENAAINSLRTLNQMEGEYNASYPTHGYTCSLHALGGKQGKGAPSADAAQLITDDMASGLKSGYRLQLSDCDSNHYRLIAVPLTVGKSGDRGFCMDDSAHLAYDPRGGSDCTEPLQ